MKKRRRPKDDEPIMPSPENNFGSWEAMRQEMSALLEAEPGLAVRLARHLGVSAAAVSQWKKGRNKPDIDHALKMVGFLRDYCREVQQK